jgi:dTDP-glucose 4,6-dehydratase
MSKILVTGGAGFIGSNFVRRLLLASDHEVVSVDALTYAGNLENLADVERHPRYRFVRGDIADAAAMDAVFAAERPTIVVHFAAESHVDRSVLDATAFVRTNVQGTQVLLDKSRIYQVQRFVHVTSVN